MIRLAIVGTGSMAGAHANTFAWIPGCKIVAGCDIDAAKAAAFCRKHAIPQSFSDVDAMLKECEIDAVVNATPDRFHAPLSLKAIAAGKHILCEKPLALNYPEAMKMVTAAEKRGVINMVNFSFRGAPAIQKAQQLVAAGKLGRIVHLEIRYLQSWLISNFWGDWRDTSSLTWKLSKGHGSKGVLGDLGIHIVDLASYVAGDIVRVSARLKTFSDLKGAKHGAFDLDANDTAMVHAEFASGALGSIITTRWATGHLNSIQLHVSGTEGALRVDLDRGMDHLEVCFGKNIHPGKWKRIPCRKDVGNARRFINSIKTGVNAQPDFRRGATIQKILDACFVSDAKGKSVTV